MPEIPANLEERLREIIAPAISRPVNDLKYETNFFKDLGIDSIKAIEIVVAVEKNFKIRIRDEQVNQIETFGQVLDIVKVALQKEQE